MFTLDCPVIIMQSADLASTEASAFSNPHMPTVFVSYQRHYSTKKEKSSCNSVLEKYIRNFTALAT